MKKSYKVILTLMFVIAAGVLLFYLVIDNKPEDNVKKDNQEITEAPKSYPSKSSVSSIPGKPKEESKDEQYSEQELETVLAWLDSLEGEDSTEPESNEVVTETSESDETEETEQQDEEGLTPEQIQRCREIERELTELVSEFHSIDDRMAELVDLLQKKKISVAYYREMVTKERDRQWEIREIISDLALEYDRMVPHAILPDGRIGKIISSIVIFNLTSPKR